MGLLFILHMIDYMNMEPRSNNMDGKPIELREKTYRRVTSSTKKCNLDKPVNPDLRGDWPATNCLSHGTVFAILKRSHLHNGWK
jgi:hypothetical protein